MTDHDTGGFKRAGASSTSRDGDRRLIYAFWPANLKRFHDVKSIPDEDDKPWK